MRTLAGLFVMCFLYLSSACNLVYPLSDQQLLVRQILTTYGAIKDATEANQQQEGTFTVTKDGIRPVCFTYNGILMPDGNYLDGTDRMTFSSTSGSVETGTMDISIREGEAGTTHHVSWEMVRIGTEATYPVFTIDAVDYTEYSEELKDFYETGP